MLFSEKAMANIGNDEAAKRAKISALVASLLKDHREALHFIPDIFEQFNALQSNEHKSTLIERENKDLKQKVESLSYDIEVKNQRIVALGQKIEAMEFIGQQSFSGERIAALGKQLEATTFTNQQSFTADRILMLEQKLEAAKVDEERKRELISSLERKLETMKSTKDLLEKRSPETQAQERSIQAMKDRNDQLIRTIEEQYINLKENDQKYEEMKRELNIKDQKLKEKEDKFLLLEKEYNSTIQDKDSGIKQMKLRYDELNHVLNTKDQELKDEKEKFQQLQKEYNSIIHNKDSDIEQMKFRINELERGANSALRCKDREIEQLKSRIASISEKKVRQDQSTVENTLSMNRQSKLEDDFKLFVDEARVDACDRIQSFCNSNEESFVRIYYPRLACLIFEAAFEQTKQAKQAFEEICKDVSKGLIHSAPGLIQIFFSYKQKRYSSYPITFTVNTSRQEMQYPTDVVDAFLLSLKESAIAHDMAFCVVDVQNTVWQKWRAWFQEDRYCKLKPDENILRDPQILSYIKKCLQLTWRMVTQVPAMTLEYQSKYLNNDLHTVVLHRSSPATFNNTASGKQEIAFYIWPGFRDGRGTVIRRGDVICKVAK